jgi:hypothetical protein
MFTKEPDKKVTSVQKQGLESQVHKRCLRGGESEAAGTTTADSHGIFSVSGLTSNTRSVCLLRQADGLDYAENHHESKAIKPV